MAISERIIIGPLYLDSSLAAPENKPPSLSDVCLKTGLRPSLIEQLANASKILGKSDFSASDLAEYLHLSQRNVSRILNTLEVNGYASSFLHRILFFYPPLQTIKKAVLTRFLSSQHRLLYYMKFSTVSHLREEINNERQDPHHNEDSKHSLPHDP